MANQFLTNYTDVTFLDKVKDNLRHCTAFHFSVSFIKKAGLVLLFKDIEAAVERGAKGRIITSTYQNFTDIESLKRFFALQSRCSNFECHLDHDSFHDSSYTTLGYHSKGYLFEFEDRCELIVGSSNITRYALLKNIEWDVLVSEERASPLYVKAMEEYEEKWDATHSLNIEIISLYSNKLNFAIERWDMDYDLHTANIKPNFMQKRALKELNRYRAVGTARALVVAAAGSGKTYLAAFDALNFSPKRLLYVVHEGSILKKALETFQDVFGNAVSYGIFSGESKEMNADFVFATNITMARSLELFPKDHYDYIIVDECHHATAETYRKIIEYFEPEFLLGLTATPERMDNQDVFDLFDKNVPYELRLRDAIINELVVPFKYYSNIINRPVFERGELMPSYRSASGSVAEDLFIDLFSEAFGAEKAGYLYSQYHFYDIYQNSRYADFVLENGARRVAIEIDDETSHNKSLVSSSKYYDDLLKQNSMVHLGWDVYRWAVRQMQIQPETVKDELRVFLGNHPQFKEIEDYLPVQRGKALRLLSSQYHP